MSLLGMAEILALGRKHGFTDAELPDLAAVVMTESGGWTDRVQGRPGGDLRPVPGLLGRGLVQIDLGQHPNVTEAQAFDPDFAMAFARRLSRNASGLGPTNWYGPRDHPEVAAKARAEARALLSQGGTPPMAKVRGGITVKPHVQRFADACQAATGADNFGTYPGHSPPEGPTQALDIFNPDSPAGYAQQDRVVDFAQANAKRFGVRYVIRREHIWNIERAAEGWRRQRHNGNRTADHYDHVHVTFYSSAAEPEPEPEPPKPSIEGENMIVQLVCDDEDWLFDSPGRIMYRITAPGVFPVLKGEKVGRYEVDRATLTEFQNVAKNAKFSG